jgi:anti-sigma B factor antagonist
MLKITKARENNALTVTLEGRLDTTTAPLLEAELKDALPGVAALTIDMHRLEYISSAGLRVLLSAQKVMNKQGEMKITAELWSESGINREYIASSKKILCYNRQSKKGDYTHERHVYSFNSDYYSFSWLPVLENGQERNPPACWLAAGPASHRHWHDLPSFDDSFFLRLSQSPGSEPERTEAY